MAYAPQLNESAYRGEQVPPTPSRRAAYRTKPCRYHQAGYCKDGQTCPFRHEENNQGARFISINCSIYSNIVSEVELRKSSMGGVSKVSRSTSRGEFFQKSEPTRCTSTQITIFHSEALDFHTIERVSISACVSKRVFLAHSYSGRPLSTSDLLGAHSPIPTPRVQHGLSDSYVSWRPTQFYVRRSDDSTG